MPPDSIRWEPCPRYGARASAQRSRYGRSRMRGRPATGSQPSRPPSSEHISIKRSGSTSTVDIASMSGGRRPPPPPTGKAPTRAICRAPNWRHTGWAEMEFGAHLPVLSLGGEPHSIEHLTGYARAASELGFTVLCANDHIVYSRPHLDALTSLSVVIQSSGRMKLMTSIALLVIRGAAPLTKALAAIDLLSGGRVVVGAGPGSSEKDYETVGVPVEERWKAADAASLQRITGKRIQKAPQSLEGWPGRRG